MEETHCSEKVYFLSSTKSLQISLRSISEGKAGLDARKKSILSRIPNRFDWAKYEYQSIELIDLAYLTSITGDEFALLRGKHEDILFHGTSRNCIFTGIIYQMLKEKRISLVGHSHPGEFFPKPSDHDRQMLKKIGQEKSTVISAVTGIMVDFGPSIFE